MICKSSGVPAAARWSHCRQASASPTYPLLSSAYSVSVASRIQQNR